MELKKVLEELEVTNDVNTLTKKELEEKYLQSEEEYKRFLEIYTRKFNDGTLFPLLVSESVETVNDVILDGNMKYNTQENVMYHERVLKEYEWLKSKFKIAPQSLGDDRYEAQFLFLESVGASRSKNERGYYQVLSKIYDGAQRYNACDKLTIRDLTPYVQSKMATSRDEIDFKQSLNHYIQDHPLLVLCNDKSYLYFVNYMLCNHTSTVDQELLNNTIDIINAGSTLQHLGYVRSDFDRRDYNRVVKYTLKNIKLYEEKREKLEAKKATITTEKPKQHRLLFGRKEK